MFQPWLQSLVTHHAFLVQMFYVRFKSDTTASGQPEKGCGLAQRGAWELTTKKTQQKLEVPPDRRRKTLNVRTSALNMSFSHTHNHYIMLVSMSLTFSSLPFSEGLRELYAHPHITFGHPSSILLSSKKRSALVLLGVFGQMALTAEETQRE